MKKYRFPNPPLATASHGCHPYYGPHVTTHGSTVVPFQPSCCRWASPLAAPRLLCRHHRPAHRSTQTISALGQGIEQTVTATTSRPGRHSSPLADLAYECKAFCVMATISARERKLPVQCHTHRFCQVDDKSMAAMELPTSTAREASDFLHGRYLIAAALQQSHHHPCGTHG
jgi:hypothetical protein